MFCVECGSEDEVLDCLCKRCFIRKGTFVKAPKTIDIVTCSHCGAVNINNRWLHVDDAVKAAVDSALEIEKDVMVTWVPEYEEEDERNLKVYINMHLETRGIGFDKDLTTKARLKSGSCKECSRQRGSYYEAIVQVRARRRDPTDDEIDWALQETETLVSKGSSFVSNILRVKGGVDIYLGRSSDGRTLAGLLSNRSGGQMIETKSQAGKKDGKDIFRSTFLVRFPSFKRGDMVPLGGSVHEIRSFTKNSVNLADVTTASKQTIPMKDMERMAIYDRGDHLRDAIVVSEQEKELQIMHPENQRTIDVKKPIGYTRGSKEIKVVMFEDDLYPYML